MHPRALFSSLCHRPVFRLTLALLALLSLTAGGSAQSPFDVTRRASVKPDGVQVWGTSRSASVSADGDFVAFQSSATALVDADTNGADDVFVHDLRDGEIERVSIGPSDVQANSSSHAPAISSNGRYVAFQSLATNLAPGDTNYTWDVFVR